MSGNHYSAVDDTLQDHSRAETGERTLDAEDPFEDEEVTAVIDAVWDDLTS